MNYGFLIDNRVCIGCHACSTACKQENEVPLGVHRTWVKSVEKGAFPDTRRHFQVTRCNHCANPPCVTICPVSAMFQRPDGIVDFDPRVCIGCKACLQACPYDAIYVDPDEGTAAKCHYCAHRVEVGLEPACVVVCPEHAIISGDLDDPASEIRRMMARQSLSVRKPEQGTAPKLFYIDGEAAALTPTASQMMGTFAFADAVTDQARAMSAPAAPTAGWNGPIHVGGERVAGQLVQTTYNAQHKIPWHWPVPAYLVTKAIGAGLPLVLASQLAMDNLGTDNPLWLAGMLVALAFTALTALLLVADLERPERFYLILTRPQWSSWLTRGAVILIAHSLWLVGLVALALAGVHDPGEGARWSIAAITIVSSVATAAYTAYLFAQAEGRDLWQSPLLPGHLVVQALVAGTSALFLVMTALHVVDIEPPTNVGWWVTALFVAALVVDAFLLLAGELAVRHASETAARAAHAITHGRYRRQFWLGAIGLGHVLPLALLAALYLGLSLSLAGSLAVVVTMAVGALAGLYLYEHAFVMAPQEVPNS